MLVVNGLVGGQGAWPQWKDRRWRRKQRLLVSIRLLRRCLRRRWWRPSGRCHHR